VTEVEWLKPADEERTDHLNHQGLEGN